MRESFILLLFFIFIFSCQHHVEQEQSFYYEDGTPKPIVAITPVIDHSSQYFEWNLSEELTCSIQERLLQKENLFLSPSNIKPQQTPFGNDLSWIKPIFAKKDFVVFLELIEHSELPLLATEQAAPENAPAELKITIRLQVIDLRQEEPKIILQELIHDTQYLPKQFTHYNFFQIPWGKESYSITPLGMAHAKLAKELSSRIEDYILLAIK